MKLRCDSKFNNNYEQNSLLSHDLKENKLTILCCFTKALLRGFRARNIKREGDNYD